MAQGTHSQHVVVSTLRQFALVALLLCLLGQHASAEVVAGLTQITFNDNGAWSWFEDERAIIANGQVIVGSTSNKAGAQGRSGRIEVANYTIGNGFLHRAELNPGLLNNDHNSPVLHVRPDGRILAVYSDHDVNAGKFSRLTVNPGDTSTWEPEQFSATVGGGVGYSNIYRLSAENGGNGLTYDFYRDKGLGWDPHYRVSTDDGDTWSYGGRLFDAPGRPYVKYASNNVTRIHFITTEQHPDLQDTGIFHGYIEDGNVYQTDGVFVSSLSTDSSTNLVPDDLTEIFSGNPNAIAWTNDIALDSSGNPYAVYSVQAGGSSSDMRYHYARWDGNQWIANEIAFGGRIITPAHEHYAGLATLNPDDPNTVYIATDADPDTGAALISSADGQRHHEIYKGVTEDFGVSWAWSPITENSTVDNVRPIVPKSDGANSAVIWLAGEYNTFVDFDMAVVGIVNDGVNQTPQVASGDFNLDTVVDLADAAILFDNLLTNQSNLSLFEAFQLGDITGDRKVDFQDFVEFDRLYDEIYGDGALSGIYANVPEPGTAWLIIGFVAIALIRCRQTICCRTPMSAC